MTRLYVDAAAESRDDAWWRERVRALSRKLDAEQRGGSIVVRARDRRVWPLAEMLAAGAPRELDVVCGRPALALESCVSLHSGSTAQFAKASVRAGFTRGHLLDVVINLPGGSGSEGELDDAESLVWELLGERRAEAWVGDVKVAPAPRGGPLRVLANASESGFPLGELPAALDAAVAGLYAGFAEQPHWARSDSGAWTLFELTPEPASDWADEDDLVMASTCVPELLKSRLSKQPFSSQRFSRHGELFFHLKYEDEGSPDERLAARRALEDTLDNALASGKVGRVVGGGLGLRYSYVLLALDAFERSLELTAHICRRAKLPLRSWLLPLDSDLACEWYAVWPHSPAPLLASEP